MGHFKGVQCNVNDVVLVDGHGTAHGDEQGVAIVKGLIE